MVLSYVGVWIGNLVITTVVSRIWTDRNLFRIMWWNLFWSLASIVVLFAAFRGKVLYCFSLVALPHVP